MADFFQIKYAGERNDFVYKSLNGTVEYFVLPGVRCDKCGDGEFFDAQHVLDTNLRELFEAISSLDSELLSIEQFDQLKRDYFPPPYFDSVLPGDRIGCGVWTVANLDAEIDLHFPFSASLVVSDVAKKILEKEVGNEFCELIVKPNGTPRRFYDMRPTRYLGHKEWTTCGQCLSRYGLRNDTIPFDDQQLLDNKILRIEGVTGYLVDVDIRNSLKELNVPNVNFIPYPADQIYDLIDESYVWFQARKDVVNNS